MALARELARYVFGARGLLTLGASSAAAFAHSRPDLAEPNLQMSFAPGSFQPGTYKLETEPGMTIAMYPSYPESRGWVRAKAGGTREMPDIQPNYLSAEEDIQAMLAGLRLMRRILGAPAFDAYSPKETRPGADLQTDAELIAYAREQGVSGYHFAGTCRMGGDAESVVTPELKVRGVERLRVIDASVMPTCTSGNNNAPTIMIAEKGASMLLADAR
jgi:choline dehydrogenase